MTVQPYKSPFSLNQHEWTLTWNRVSYNEKYDFPYETQSVKEQQALEAIASVGCIGGKQLKTLFNLTSKNMKNMIGRKQIVQHEITEDGKRIPIYTLGKSGANKVMPQYISNYWVEMNLEDVLKNLCFFKLCESFDNVSVQPAPKPFVATLLLSEKEKHKSVSLFVYVSRGNINDLMMFLKWHPFKERMLIVTESLSTVKPLEPFLLSTKLKIRLIMDENMEKKPVFYRFDLEQQDWTKE